MPNNPDVTTPILEESGVRTFVSQVTKKCLDAIEKYWKSTRRPTNKVVAIHDVSSYLATAMPQLTEDEINDSLATYLTILEQHDKAIKNITGVQSSDRSETFDDSVVGSKRACSPGTDTTAPKKAKVDNSDFP
jgi:hypothetical protein